MSLTDMLFVFLFLPAALVFYYTLGRWFKDYILLFLSIIFYAAGSAQYTVLFITVIAIVVLVGRIMAGSKNLLLKRILLIIGITPCVFILIYYKYSKFGLSIVNCVFGKTFQLSELMIPLGISFFTFKAISYLADIYTDRVEMNPNPVHDALYMSFFAQITAGPITRYNDMREHFESDRASKFNPVFFSDGVYRFIIGFNKKILLANTFSVITNEVFGAPATECSAAFLWLGSICYSLELYYDFAGYSDMAIGVSEMFGYRCMENFNYPYMTESVSKFWRRWHISLSQWFRDYVYIPLGGSHNDKPYRTYLNLLVVWILTGIWHGANWTYIAWGLGFFLMISFERLTGLPERIKSEFGRTFYRIFTLIFINFEWVMFRSESIRDGFSFIENMTKGNNNSLTDLRTVVLIKEYYIFIVAGLLLCFPIIPVIERKIGKANAELAVNTFGIIKAVSIVLLFIWAISFVVAGQNNPFAYANF